MNSTTGLFVGSEEKMSGKLLTASLEDVLVTLVNIVPKGRYEVTGDAFEPVAATLAQAHKYILALQAGDIMLVN